MYVVLYFPLIHNHLCIWWIQGYFLTTVCHKGSVFKRDGYFYFIIFIYRDCRLCRDLQCWATRFQRLPDCSVESCKVMISMKGNPAYHIIVYLLQSLIHIPLCLGILDNIFPSRSNLLNIEGLLEPNSSKNKNLTVYTGRYLPAISE